MTVEEASKIWAAQTIPVHTPRGLAELVRRQNSKSKYQLYVSLVFVVLCLIFGVLNFYGQYFVNGDDLLVTSLRFSIVLIAIPIHVQAHRKLAALHRERVAASANHHDWLCIVVESLESELRGHGQWKLGLYFAIVFAVVSLTKWLDFLSGADTLAECIAIPMLVLGLIVLVAASVRHHRRAFLAPEYRRYSRMLEEARHDP